MSCFGGLYLTGDSLRELTEKKSDLCEFSDTCEKYSLANLISVGFEPGSEQDAQEQIKQCKSGEKINCAHYQNKRGSR